MVLLQAPVGYAQTTDAPTSPQQGRINNWVELRTALRRCWTPPSGTEGSFISFQFGLTREGAIRGAPRVTATRLVGNAESQKLFRDSVFEALKKCFPAPLTREFGALMGEAVIFLSFVDGKRELSSPFARYQNYITVFSAD
jgi:hypothetical protein